MSSSVTEKMKALFPSTSFSLNVLQILTPLEKVILWSGKRKQSALSQLPSMLWLLGGLLVLYQGGNTQE